MESTVEASPWHREANVAVHTEMCIQYYMDTFAPIRGYQSNKIAILALLFHDTGKPSAEEVVEKKDDAGTLTGEVYRRYAGHEQDSAVTFTECYLTMPELRALISDMEARAIRWIIENHLPYGMKDAEKRRCLRIGTGTALQYAFVRVETFFDCLRSDANGRISDDMPQKLQNVEEWIADFEKIPGLAAQAPVGNGELHMLIGPSASGKTTYRHQLTFVSEGLIRAISADELKLHFYLSLFPGDAKLDRAAVYDAAWKYCTLDHPKEFEKFFREKYTEEAKAMSSVNGILVVDLVNASRKARRVWIELAKRFNMKVTMVEFWTPLEVLIARQSTRGDKQVPVSSIKQQVFSMSTVANGYECHMHRLITYSLPH